MGLVKKFKKIYIFLLGKRDQENVFDDLLERKKAFLDCNNKDLKKSKN